MGFLGGGGGGGGNSSPTQDPDYKALSLPWHQNLVNNVFTSSDWTDKNANLALGEDLLIGGATAIENMQPGSQKVYDSTVDMAAGGPALDTSGIDAKAIREAEAAAAQSNQLYNMAGMTQGAGSSRAGLDMAGIQADLSAKLAQNQYDAEKFNVEARQVATQLLPQISATTSGLYTQPGTILSQVGQRQGDSLYDRYMKEKNVAGMAQGNQVTVAPSGGCVIATHAVAAGMFDYSTKKNAIDWCEKTLHNKWWGEIMRRGYRYLGRKHIANGTAEKVYDEFKSCLEWANGKRPFTFKIATRYYYRAAQTFIVGLFVKEKNNVV